MSRKFGGKVQFHVFFQDHDFDFSYFFIFSYLVFIIQYKKYLFQRVQDSHQYMSEVYKKFDYRFDATNREVCQVFGQFMLTNPRL